MDLGPPPNGTPSSCDFNQSSVNFKVESPGPHRVEFSCYGLTDNPDALNLGWRQAIWPAIILLLLLVDILKSLIKTNKTLRTLIKLDLCHIEQVRLLAHWTVGRPRVESKFQWLVVPIPGSESGFNTSQNAWKNDFWIDLCEGESHSVSGNKSSAFDPFWKKKFIRIRIMTPYASWLISKWRGPRSAPL